MYVRFDYVCNPRNDFLNQYEVSQKCSISHNPLHHNKQKDPSPPATPSFHHQHHNLTSYASASGINKHRSQKKYSKKEISQGCFMIILIYLLRVFTL